MAEKAKIAPQSVVLAERTQLARAGGVRWLQFVGGVASDGNLVAWDGAPTTGAAIAQFLGGPIIGTDLGSMTFQILDSTENSNTSFPCRSLFATDVGAAAYLRMCSIGHQPVDVQPSICTCHAGGIGSGKKRE